MIRGRQWFLGLLCAACTILLAGCGFHLRGSAAVPAVMQQQVYLLVSGGGEFPRSLAAALRASKVNVLDTPAAGVATLSVPVAAFGSRMLTSGAVQKIGEYVVTFNVNFTLTDAQGKTVVPMQTITLSHEFAIDQSQFSAITSETEAIQRSLVREMTDAVMRRLEAQAKLGAPVAPASAPASAASTAAPAPASASTAG